MEAFLYIIIFIIGTLFGSFFTLAVYRIPLKKDITHERSYCPNCNHKLSFWDMIPILSYLFLGGKCRYCKQKIRVRYLLLEILSGLCFVLFAMSLKISLATITLNQAAFFLFGLLYIATLFIISGIDKEKHKIEKSVLLFGYMIEALYIMYLYIVEKDPNIYRYVIYLGIVCVLLTLDTVFLRKKVKSNYIVEILLLCMLLVTYTYESVVVLTITFSLLAIGIKLLLNKVLTKKYKGIKKERVAHKPIPVGFYLCVTNIITFIIVNFYVFY